jgi:hypothetical protein
MPSVPDSQHVEGDSREPESPQTRPPLRPEVEIGGPSGPEPTRFGDWERKGRCIDF